MLSTDILTLKRHTRKTLATLARKWDVLDNRSVLATQGDLDLLTCRFSRVVCFAYLGSPMASRMQDGILGFNLQKRMENLSLFTGLCSWSLEMRYRFYMVSQ